MVIIEQHSLRTHELAMVAVEVAAEIPSDGGRAGCDWRHVVEKGLDTLST